MEETPIPFFAHSDPGNDTRRLLLLSFHFPPGDSVGALRWGRMATHFAAGGWGLDVVTVDPSSLRSSDPSGLSVLPPGIRVFGSWFGPLLIDRWERYAWSLYTRLRRRRPYSKASRASLSSTSPKARPASLSRSEIAEAGWSVRTLIRTYYWYLYFRRNLRWARGAQAVGLKLAKTTKYRAIVSCGPPHEAHFAGAAVARAAGLPHVVDMRDPWSLGERSIEITATPLAHPHASRNEAKTLSSASLIVMNTEAARHALVRKYPLLEPRVIVVTNGFDDETPPQESSGHVFVMAYAGSIYLDRTPKELFQAARLVIDARALSPDEFLIEFMGSEEISGGVTLASVAEDAGIRDFVKLHGPSSRANALRLLSRAAILVSLPQDSDTAIPSKIFEYMPFNAWLLALADKGSATFELLDGSGADLVTPHDVDLIAARIGERYDQFRRSGRPVAPALIAQCSRRFQAERLMRAIEALDSGRYP